MTVSSHRRMLARARKAGRRSNIGREFESTLMPDVLERMVEQKLIDAFVFHQPHSQEDSEGRDFTVTKDKVTRSFGVTISRQSWKVSRLRHPLVTQFHFPIGTSPETIRKRVLQLFVDTVKVD